jgi:heme-degrading monooxygenase HmoA
MPRCLTIGRVQLDPGKRAIAEAVADRGIALVTQQPGCEGVTFFLDEQRNLYCAVSYWASREAAEAADAVLNPGFSQAFGEHLTTPIVTEFYEIYEPTPA